MIELSNVVKDYHIRDATYQGLKSVSLSVNQGEFAAIMGPSGCGKTTTMNILGLLDKPTSGSYHLLNNDTSQFTHNQQADFRNEFIGFIFQSFLLLPRLTAVQNVGLPLMYRKKSRQEVRKQAEAMLERVGMNHFLHHHPYELSGGQQQRVAIARALVGEPKLILADEPTGALDVQTSNVVMSLLKDIYAQRHVTVLVITHDPDEAKECQRVIHIRDGKIQES